MANPLRQLAGETAIYGLSTILARIINFFFVPFYTRLLTTESYGVFTEFMAYIAIFQVVLVLGLETGCFRFASREGADSGTVYSNALAVVSGVSLAFLAVLLAFSSPIASALGYGGYENCIMYVGWILAIDSVTAILFAKLRQEHKALKFAVFKTVKILTETAANFVFFFAFPPYCESVAAERGVALSELTPENFFPLRFISSTPDFSYAIFAILVSCIVCGILFLPDLLKFSFRFDRKLLKQMLAYSIPLMVAALPGILNDFLDRILFRYFDTNSEAWRSSLGIFQAGVKLSVIMSLFIQMFRFAAEPFFFQRTADRNSRELYAKVMEYFTAFCGLVFLGVTLFIDEISLFLGRDFRAGADVVPIMLLSYMLLGMLFNVSMWYKLSGKTSMAIYITLAGLAVTTLVNVVFMPRYSYWAAAFGHLTSYVVMLVICTLLGRKYYPIPYRWGKIFLTIVLMIGLYLFSSWLDATVFPAVHIGESPVWQVIARDAVHLLIILVYAGLSLVSIRFSGQQKHNQLG